MLAAELIRQQGFDRQAHTINEGSRERFVGFEPQQQERAASIGDELASRVADPNAASASVMPSSSSNVVNQESAKQVGEAQQFVDQQTGAMAQMRSLGDLLGEKARLQSRDATEIGTINSFKQGSQNVMPIELDQASKAGDGWKLFADILGGMGSIGTSYGINNGSSNLSSSLTKMFGNKTTDPVGFGPGSWKNFQSMLGVT